MRARGAAAVTAVVLLGLSAAGVTAYLGSRHDGNGGRLTRSELAAYQAGILPPLREGGVVVEQRMKPAVSGLAQAPAAALAQVAADAPSWVGQLAAVRTKVAAVPAPAELAEAAAGFDRALARYAEAARQFGAAADAPAASRAAAAAAAVDVARDADALYDGASAVIQRARRRLGLGPTPDFPDPETDSPPTPTEGT
jgi:hypothetical protein